MMNIDAASKTMIDVRQQVELWRLFDIGVLGVIFCYLLFASFPLLIEIMILQIDTRARFPFIGLFCLVILLPIAVHMMRIRGAPTPHNISQYVFFSNASGVIWIAEIAYLLYAGYLQGIIVSYLLLLYAPICLLFIGAEKATQKLHKELINPFSLNFADIAAQVYKSGEEFDWSAIRYRASVRSRLRFAFFLFYIVITVSLVPSIFYLPYFFGATLSEFVGIIESLGAWWYVLVVSGGILALAVLHWLTRGWQILAKLSVSDAAEVLRRTDSKPAVLIRSFGDDDATVWSDELGLDTRYWGPARFEASISDGLGRILPLLAIGRPKEAMPLLGAARSYFADANWQEEISKWFDQAAMIIGIGGTTEGLQWEVRTLEEKGLLSKLVVLFPPDGADGQFRRWMGFATLVADPLVRTTLEAMEPKQILAANICQKHVLAVGTTGKRTSTAYKVALIIMAHMILIGSGDKRA